LFLLAKKENTRKVLKYCFGGGWHFNYLWNFTFCMGVHIAFLYITKTKFTDEPDIYIYIYDKYTMWFLTAVLSCFMLNSQWCILQWSFMYMQSNLMGEKSLLNHSYCMAQVTAVSEYKFHAYFRWPHFVAVNQDIQNWISDKNWNLFMYLSLHLSLCHYFVSDFQVVWKAGENFTETSWSHGKL